MLGFCFFTDKGPLLIYWDTLMNVLHDLIKLHTVGTSNEFFKSKYLYALALLALSEPINANTGYVHVLK